MQIFQLLIQCEQHAYKVNGRSVALASIGYFTAAQTSSPDALCREIGVIFGHSRCISGTRWGQYDVQQLT